MAGRRLEHETGTQDCFYLNSVSPLDLNGVLSKHADN